MRHCNRNGKSVELSESGAVLSIRRLDSSDTPLIGRDGTSGHANPNRHFLQRQVCS